MLGCRRYVADRGRGYGTTTVRSIGGDRPSTASTCACTRYVPRGQPAPISIPMTVLFPGAMVSVPLPRQTGGAGSEASTAPWYTRTVSPHAPDAQRKKTTRLVALYAVAPMSREPPTGAVSGKASNATVSDSGPTDPRGATASEVHPGKRLMSSSDPAINQRATMMSIESLLQPNAPVQLRVVGAICALRSTMRRS